MNLFTGKIRRPRLFRLSGLNDLDLQLQKFRDLRDSYHEANRKYYGKFFAALLDGSK